MATVALNNQRIRISNPPKAGPSFKIVVDEIADKITWNFMTASCNDADLSRFGMSLLDVQDPADNQDKNNVQLMRIQSQTDSVKKKFEQLLSFWVTARRDPKWENVIEALRRIGLHNLANELADELKSNQSQNGFQTEEPSIQGDTSKPEKEPERKPEINESELRQKYEDRKFESDVIEANANVKNLKEQQLRVLIQTVNLNEYFAVMIQLKEGCKVQQYTVDGSTYYVGKWGEHGIPVVILQTNAGKDGRHGSFNETKKALEWLPHLKYIFAVGVCGGIKANKVKLGDVVVSKVIQPYSGAKLKGVKRIGRSTPWDIAKKDTFHQFLSRAVDNAKCGVVLSGNLLMASEDAQKQYLDIYPEAIAFEMEGDGIAEACDGQNIIPMVVKGVSDLADEEKSDDWQPQAAMNAVQALYKAMEASKRFARTDTITNAMVGKEMLIEETQEGEVNGKTVKGLDNQGND